MSTRKYTNRRYLDALEKKVIVFDGAMGTNLQSQQLTAENFGGGKLNGCNDHLVISNPEAVEKVHRSFLEVGVDVIETNTFRANRLTMAEYGLEKRVIEINQAAASLARRIAVSTHSLECQRFHVQRSTCNPVLLPVLSAQAENCRLPMTLNSPMFPLTTWLISSASRRSD